MNYKGIDMNKLLLIIDPQIDFITGSLIVPGAEQAMNALADYVTENEALYSGIVVTLDWHPLNHSSFIRFGGQWPAHCVAHSVGAAVWQPLIDSFSNINDKIVFLEKGTSPDKEEYSIFANHRSSEKLVSLVSELSIERIDLCGLAGDVCVANTLSDGVSLLGHRIWHILPSFTPSIDGGKTLTELIKTLNVTCDPS